MYKERKETTYERVGERKTYINNIEEKISTMYVYKWSQDLMYKNNVSKKERKEKIHNILTTFLKKKPNPPPNKMIQKLTLPLKVTTLISKTTSPFCHELQRVECQVDISSVELASPSSSEASSSSPSSSSLSSSALESEATR